MKLYKTLISFISTLIPLALSAQNADQRINELLGSGDWFALNREYSEVKDSVRSDILKSMTEIMLAAYFNRPEELGGSLSALIDNHSEELGLQNVCNMLMLGAVAEGSNGRYALAADMVKSVIDRIIVAGGSIEGTGLDDTYKYFNAVRDFPRSVNIDGAKIRQSAVLYKRHPCKRSHICGNEAEDGGKEQCDVAPCLHKRKEIRVYS